MGRRRRAGGEGGNGGKRRGPRGWWVKAPQEIVIGAEAGIRAGRPASEVYATLSLGRFCSRRAFRRWAAGVRTTADRPATYNRNEATDAEVVGAVRAELVRRARAQTLRASFVHECRLLIAALSKRRSAGGSFQ